MSGVEIGILKTNFVYGLEFDNIIKNYFSAIFLAILLFIDISETKFPH